MSKVQVTQNAGRTLAIYIHSTGVAVDYTAYIHVGLASEVMSTGIGYSMFMIDLRPV